MSRSRRTFFKRFSGLLAGASLFSITMKAAPQKKNRFIHNVYFWLKNPASKEDAAKLEEGIKSLSKVKFVKDFFIGKPATTDRPVIDNTYSFHLMLTFDNLDDQTAYQSDPIHLKFVDNYAQLWGKVQVYDSDSSLIDA